MTSNSSPTGISRYRGCTLTGALSVTTHIRDAVSVVHGPRGCSHHNLSLLHATGMENDRIPFPDLVSTSLSESDVIFGGEETLRKTLESVALQKPGVIFVLSTCVIDTIGDDVEGISSHGYGVPVIPIPTAGFLGGTFQDGVTNALLSIAATAPDVPVTGGVNIIGERNLEYEVEENFLEISRILASLGLGVNTRFIHESSMDRISLLGRARLNILREPALAPVGEYLRERFGTPYIASFPHGFSGTISFIRDVADVCGVEGSRAIREEERLQEKILETFADIRSSPAALDRIPADPEEYCAAEEAAGLLDIHIGSAQDMPALPAASSIGTFGIKRMLHRWRRALHA